MSYLFSKLPPFAADYSGVASALHDLGGIVVIHDASGCTGSYTGYDEPRWFGSKSKVFCSGLREFDAIMGNDEKLLSNIQRTIHDELSEFVAIIGSPVPMLVGFDYDGFANMVEHETGVPAFGFPTTGLGLYDKGLSAAFLEMAKRFVMPVGASLRQGVNILGASPLDNFDEQAINVLKTYLEACGLQAVSIWGQASDLTGIARAGTAAVNWVVSAAALPLARYMKTQWDIPYVFGLPFDASASTSLKVNLISAANALPLTSPAQTISQENEGTKHIVLLGEQMRMHALRCALREKRSEWRIRVASFFAWEEELSEPGDAFMQNEAHAMSWLAEQKADVVVGDPLFRQLLPLQDKNKLIEEPHVAVSGRLHRYSVARHFGSEGEAFIKQLLDMGNGAQH